MSGKVRRSERMIASAE